MQVLLTETDSPAAVVAARVLTDAGHVVHHCYEPGSATYCVADVGLPCPLDAAPIDVVASVHAGDGGGRCGVRHKVPVAVIEGDPSTAGTAVAAAARQPLCAHSIAATDAFRRSLMVAGLPASDGAGVQVQVRRKDGYLHVTISAPFVVPEAIAQRGAVRICQVLRELDPHARGIDVASPRVVTEVSR